MCTMKREVKYYIVRRGAPPTSASTTTMSISKVVDADGLDSRPKMLVAIVSSPSAAARRRFFFRAFFFCDFSLSCFLQSLRRMQWSSLHPTNVDTSLDIYFKNKNHTKRVRS
jgi:hypothetical protein